MVQGSRLSQLAMPVKEHCKLLCMKPNDWASFSGRMREYCKSTRGQALASPLGSPGLAVRL